MCKNCVLHWFVLVATRVVIIQQYQQPYGVLTYSVQAVKVMC